MSGSSLKTPSAIYTTTTSSTEAGSAVSAASAVPGSLPMKRKLDEPVSVSCNPIGLDLKTDVKKVNKRGKLLATFVDVFVS